MIATCSSFQFSEGFIKLVVNVWRGAVLLKEEKIEHESGEDSLKGTTEPTNLRPIVSPFLPTTPQVTRFKLKKKKKEKKQIIMRRSASLEVRNAQNI